MNGLPASQIRCIGRRSRFPPHHQPKLNVIDRGEPGTGRVVHWAIRATVGVLTDPVQEICHRFAFDRGERLTHFPSVVP